MSHRLCGTTQLTLFPVQDPVHHVAAERAISVFRESTQALEASVHVLQHSASADACFHAALALRVAAIRFWQRLAPPEQAQLRSFVLTRAQQLSYSPGSSAALSNTLCALNAVLLKLGWLDMGDDAQRAALGVRRITSDGTVWRSSKRQQTMHAL